MFWPIHSLFIVKSCSVIILILLYIIVQCLWRNKKVCPKSCKACSEVVPLYGTPDAHHSHKACNKNKQECTNMYMLTSECEKIKSTLTLQNTHCCNWCWEFTAFVCRYWLYMMVAACSLCLLQSCLLQSFFHLVRLFWYHVFTCFSVSPRDEARVHRSNFVRYFCWSNLLSSFCSCTVVKAVRFFFLKDFTRLGLSLVDGLLISSCASIIAIERHRKIYMNTA